MNTRVTFLLLMFIFSSSSLLSCNSLDDQLKRQAEITGEAQADRTTVVTNQDNERKWARMEKDLDARRHFYDCLQGTYQGTTQSEVDSGARYDITVTVTANLPPAYTLGRQRTDSEIMSDMSSLSFKAIEVTLSNPAIPAMQVPGSGKVLPEGVRPWTFENVQSDLVSGRIDLISSSSPTHFALWLMSDGSFPKGSDRALVGSSSTGVMRSVIQGEKCKVAKIWIEMRASNLSTTPFGAELHRSDAK